jgi:restriction system protein
MKEFYRVMLGRGSMYAQACREQGYIGAGFDNHQDLTGRLPEDFRQFNQEFIPIWQEANPGRSIISAGLCCGFLWTICKGIQQGDIILSPDGKGTYFVGEVQSDYRFVPGAEQPHQRQVHWRDDTIDRSAMSEALRRSTGSVGTVSQVSKYREELETLIKGGSSKQVLISADGTIEDPTVFALEKHLEDFLVANWSQTPLGKQYDIFQEEDNFGQQFPTDTGSIDILAISKDKQEVLVVELKKGRASDAVVGQIQRYMGYIAEEIAEDHQRVIGVIIALEDDLRIRRSLKVAPSIGFYRYEVNLT